MKQAGVVVFLLLFFFSNSFSQSFNQTIRGVIADEDSKLPIAGATVEIEGSNPLKAMVTGSGAQHQHAGRYCAIESCGANDR